MISFEFIGVIIDLYLQSVNLHLQSNTNYKQQLK